MFYFVYICHPSCHIENIEKKSYPLGCRKQGGPLSVIDNGGAFSGPDVFLNISHIKMMSFTLFLALLD